MPSAFQPFTLWRIKESSHRGWAAAIVSPHTAAELFVSQNFSFLSMSTFNPGTCVSSVCPGGGVPLTLVCVHLSITGRPLHIDHNGIAVTHSRNPNRSASREVACHPARFLAMRSMQTRRIFNDLQWSVFDF